MLSRARQANTNAAAAARQEAIATIYLWWDALPQTTRNNIDFRVNHWQHSHRATDAVATKRKVDMVLSEIRNRPDARSLAVAVRKPK